jgi:hypothetical protein
MSLLLGMLIIVGEFDVEPFDILESSSTKRTFFLTPMVGTFEFVESAMLFISVTEQ